MATAQRLLLESLFRAHGICALDRKCLAVCASQRCGGSPGWGNGEMQRYTKGAATVSGGALHIQITADTATNSFGSARLSTSSRQGFAPAPGETLRVEARIQMPQGLPSQLIQTKK